MGCFIAKRVSLGGADHLGRLLSAGAAVPDGQARAARRVDGRVFRALHGGRERARHCRTRWPGDPAGTSAVHRGPRPARAVPERGGQLPRRHFQPRPPPLATRGMDGHHHPGRRSRSRHRIKADPLPALGPRRRRHPERPAALRKYYYSQLFLLFQMTKTASSVIGTPKILRVKATEPASAVARIWTANSAINTRTTMRNSIFPMSR